MVLGRGHRPAHRWRNRTTPRPARQRDYGLCEHDIPFAAITSPVDLCHADSGNLEELIAVIRAELPDPALVVIDTVSRVLAGGNENAPDDMGALVRALDRLRDTLGCHVLAVHHLGKDINRGGRGHSLLHCAIDTEITVTRDDAVSISTASITKQRDGISGQQIAFRLQPVELDFDVDGDPVTSCVVEPVGDYQPAKAAARALTASQRRALELLAEAISRAGEVPPADNNTSRRTCPVSLRPYGATIATRARSAAATNRTQSKNPLSAPLTPCWPRAASASGAPKFGWFNRDRTPDITRTPPDMSGSVCAGQFGQTPGRTRTPLQGCPSVRLSDSPRAAVRRPFPLPASSENTPSGCCRSRGTRRRCARTTYRG
jgi:AAA domain